MNLPPSAESRPNDLNGGQKNELEKQKRTICQRFVPCFIFTHVVDAAVGRIILSDPVPALEEVVAFPLAVEIKLICPNILKE